MEGNGTKLRDQKIQNLESSTLSHSRSGRVSENGVRVPAKPNALDTQYGVRDLNYSLGHGLYIKSILA